MENEKLIQIQMLGEFAICNQYHKFPQETKKSMQVIMLMSYLIVHRNTLTSKVQLMDILWPKGVADNPEGALRNLVYRARQEMKKFFPDQKTDCILSKNNTYIWNEELPCHLDIAEMESLAAEILQEQDIDHKLKLCECLLADYGQEFMFEFPYQEWIEEQRMTYNKIKVQCVNETCLLLEKAQRYEEIIQLCDKVDVRDYTNHKLHELKLYAYHQLDMPVVALSYYHKIVDLYYSRLGISISARMKEIYEMILDKTTKNPVNLKDLEKEMNEEEFDQGSFYCDFDVFKNIYRINVRSAKRNSKSRYLVLMTLKDDSNSLGEKRMQEESDLLRDIIGSDLRKNDVFSKCNSLQYSIILATSKLDGCEKAVERIMKRYDHRKKETCLSVRYDIKDIS